MFGRQRRLVREVEHHLAASSLFEDRDVSSAATLLFMVGSGVELSDQSRQALVERLAEVADAHNADPDQIQAALLAHEPTLVGR